MNNEEGPQYEKVHQCDEISDSNTSSSSVFIPIISVSGTSGLELMFTITSSIRMLINWILFFVFVSSLLLLIIWDLKTVQTLSAIIHDDHADFWVTLNTSEMSSWYTPMDLCILQSNSTIIDIETFKEENCSEYVDTEIPFHLQRFCSIGTSLGKQCPLPLSTRSYFAKRLNDPFSGRSEKSKPLDVALMKLAAKRQALVFIGDGLTKQNQIALICEIHRTSSTPVNIYGDFYGTNITIEWPENDLSIDIHYFYVRTLRNFANKNKALPISNTGSSANNNSNTSPTTPMLKERFQSLLDTYTGLVVIANVGAWYNTRDKFRNDIAPFLRWLGDIGKDNLIFFRETASQHWNHTNNGYFANDGSSTYGECVPLADSTPELDWRNYDVEKYIENQQLQNVIHIIKFRDITSPLFDMHPSTSEQKDCTHFCYFPQLWESVWNIVSAEVFEMQAGNDNDATVTTGD